VKVRFAVSIGAGPPDPGLLADVAAQAEEGGFDTLWVSDLPSLPAAEPSLALAFVAARTSRVRLGANFIPFGATPFVVAHRLAQLDRLTRGRLLVTLVPGLDLPEERAALGTAGRHRGRLLERLVPMLRRWWEGGVPGGEPPARLAALPVQRPLEVWLGGAGPDAVGRAGRVADGWLGSLVSPARAGRVRRAIDDEAARVGRRIDPEHFGLAVGYARRPEDAERAARIPGTRRRLEDVDLSELIPVGGAGLRRLLGQLTDEGLSKFVLRPLAAPSSAARWSQELAWLADTVLDLQT
jgi:alkanesulfonate monooxygenase SsuD/methylene tetrahydromethanopterin reductase-like flavin-dependent oxidoreductase (luciferase family)